MSIKRRVGGYRNRENFNTAIDFHRGGLPLYPQQTRMDQNAPSDISLGRVECGFQEPPASETERYHSLLVLETP